MPTVTTGAFSNAYAAIVCVMRAGGLPAVVAKWSTTGRSSQRLKVKLVVKIPHTIKHMFIITIQSYHTFNHHLSLLTDRTTFKANVILLPLLWLTWVFGILAVVVAANPNANVFAWLFTIFNSLQVSTCGSMEFSLRTVYYVTSKSAYSILHVIIVSGAINV